jgi:hypothetical protein
MDLIPHLKLCWEASHSNSNASSCLPPVILADVIQYGFKFRQSVRKHVVGFTFVCCDHLWTNFLRLAVIPFSILSTTPVVLTDGRLRRFALATDSVARLRDQVLYCAVGWNAGIRKLLNKHCTLFLTGFRPYICFQNSNPFLKKYSILQNGTSRCTFTPHEHFCTDRYRRNCLFQQDGVTCQTSGDSIARVHEPFTEEKTVSNGLWPPRSPDLSTFDFFLGDIVRAKVTNQILTI